jgi:hypothetical protein
MNAITLAGIAAMGLSAFRSQNAPTTSFRFVRNMDEQAGSRDGEYLVPIGWLFTPDGERHGVHSQSEARSLIKELRAERRYYGRDQVGLQRAIDALVAETKNYKRE